MPKSAATRASDIPAKERILKAAIRRFARHSYEDTGLRDIANDADVDVAYVHRSVGSKEQLFTEVLTATVQPERLLSPDTDTFSRHLVGEVFQRQVASRDAETGPLEILVRSLSSPAAASVIRECILRDFIAPMSQHLDEPARLRTSMICALLLGVGILRDVVTVPQLQESAGGNMHHLLVTTIDHIVSSAMDAELVPSKGPGE